MNEVDINQKIFNWFFEKIRSLQSHEKNIKIDKYTLVFKHINVNIKFDEKIIDIIMINRLGPKTSPEYLENCSIEFFAYGLSDNYTNIGLYKDDNNYKINIHPELPEKSIDKFLNIVKDEINGDEK